MQPILKNKANNSGFTLVELLVVLAILGLLLGSIFANYAAQRIPRSLKIAENELVTNIKKAQGFALVSRNLPGGTPVQFYVLKFDSAMPDRYFIQAITLSNQVYSLQTTQTVMLPTGIRFAATNPFTITTPVPQTQTPTCALLGFQLPYGKIYTNSGCNYTGAWDPNPVNNDYAKFTSFSGNSAINTASVDSKLTIVLSSSDGSMSKNVMVNGISGQIDFQ